MRQSEKKNIIKVGIFIISMSIIFMIFVLNLSKENSWFEERIIVKARLPQANNLKEGAIVQFRGIRIGVVKKIEIQDFETIQLSISLQAQYLKWIKSNSKVDIVSKGLVGDKMLQIVNGDKNANEFNPESDFLSAKKSLSMDDFVKKGDTIATSLETTLMKLNNTLEQINKNSNLNKTMNSLSKASSRLSRILYSVEKKKVVKKLSSVLVNLEKTTKRINHGPGTMHSLVYKDSVYKQMEKILGGAQRSDILQFFIQKSLDEAPLKK